MSNNKQAIEYYQSISSQIVEFCKPLNDYLGISFFIYSRVYKKTSQYSFISNDLKVTQDHINNVHYSNVFFRDYLNNKSKYQNILWPSEPQNDAMEAYFKHGHWHGVSLISQTEEYIEGVGFLADKDNHRINDFYIRNISLLEKYVDHFKAHFKNNIIAKSHDNLAKFSQGCDFYIPPKVEIDAKKIDDFMRASGLKSPPLLTKREMQCLELVDKGCSAKIIGRELLLSPKTIENHLNNIRQKTGLYHRHDLVKFYRELF
jgi:DNA-binding CsgD family transcriptional regulator